MMRRIDLLPESHLRRRRERRTIGSIIVAGVIVVLLLAVYWVFLNMQVSDEEDRLAEVQTQNAQLEAQIAELQRFADLDAEVQAKKTALATVTSGDVDWPAVFTEVAMVIPGEVWLSSFNASAGTTEGAEPAETETAAVRVSKGTPFGRITFTGNSLTMPGVAKWLVRQGTVKDFEAAWLNNAAETKIGDTNVIEFGSTIELNDKAASLRFQGGELS